MQLVDSPADIVAQVLIQLSLGTDPSLNLAWPVYSTNQPSVPDDCLTVCDTAEVKDGRTMKDGESLVHFGFQVMVRSSDYSGWAKAQAVRTALDSGVKDSHVTVGSSTYNVSCVAKTNLMSLGKDAPNSKRSLFTVNGTTAIQRTS